MSKNLQTVLRTAGITLLVLGLIAVSPAIPALLAPLPTPADRLPANWIPAGTQLTLDWQEPITYPSRTYRHYTPRPWFVLNDRFLYLAQHTQATGTDQPYLRLEKKSDYDILHAHPDCRVRAVLPADGAMWWIVAEVLPKPGHPLIAARFDPATRSILDQVQLLPLEDESELKQRENLAVFELPRGDGLLIVGGENNSQSHHSWIWQVGQPVRSIEFAALEVWDSDHGFTLADGSRLIGDWRSLKALSETGPAQLAVTSRGKELIPPVTEPRAPIGWTRVEDMREPSLAEPSMTLNQTYLGIQHPENLEALGYARKSPEGLGLLTSAWDLQATNLRSYAWMFRIRGWNHEPPFWSVIDEPLSITTPSGTQAMTDDTGQAMVSAGGPGEHSLSLYRLNTTQALAVQIFPDPADLSMRPTFWCRFGVLDQGKTAIDWYAWTVLPRTPDWQLFYPRLEIQVSGDRWTAALQSRLYGEVHVATRWLDALAEIPAPPNVTVDGTGWLVRSR